MNSENWLNELEDIEDAGWIYSLMMDIRTFLSSADDYETMEYIESEFSNILGG